MVEYGVKNMPLFFVSLDNDLVKSYDNLSKLLFINK